MFRLELVEQNLLDNLLAVQKQRQSLTDANIVEWGLPSVKGKFANHLRLAVIDFSLLDQAPLDVLKVQLFHPLPGLSYLVGVQLALLEFLKCEVIVANHHKLHLVEITQPHILPCLLRPIILAAPNRDGLALGTIL